MRTRDRSDQYFDRDVGDSTENCPDGPADSVNRRHQCLSTARPRTTIMDESAGVSERFDRTSPWPILVGLGLALGEFGVFFGGIFVPVGVAGIVLFVGSIVGLLVESGYVETHARAALMVGGIVVAFGVLIGGFSALSAEFDLFTRAITVVAGGVLAIGAGAVLGLVEVDRT